MKYVLALDQGTTSSRAILFDARGRAVASAQRELTQYFPQPGWVEHDPDEIWRTQLDCGRAALAEAAIAPGDVAAIGITNQRETTVLWDRASGRPLAPAIVWQDRRTAGRCAELKAAGHEALFRARTGLLLDPYFSGTKLAWLLDAIPGARQRAERGELAFGTIDSWLVWQLTGGRRHVSDPSHASRTLLFDIRRGTWDDDLLGVLDIPPALLPEVVPSSGVVATCDRGLFGAEIRIAGIAGDQQAATFGQACFTPGMAKNTYGTGCFMLMNTGTSATASTSGLLTTVAWDNGGGSVFALEGSVFMAGAITQWLRDGLGIIKSAGEIEALAGSVPDSGGVVMVPAFSGLGAPWWDPGARGTLLGMTRGTTHAHIARAALDAISLQSADLAGAMIADSGIALAELRVDGGAARNNLLMQLQADLLGVPVVRPRITETTALGAACLAGIGVGLWAGEDEVAAQWRLERRFEPAIPDAARAERIDRWRAAVAVARRWQA
ncbi:MAG: glycerol kinase GlpK [Dechloromonas sp.]|nr:MAG: glycerol kinase GlpK [Dechloromonas sp.]